MGMCHSQDLRGKLPSISHGIIDTHIILSLDSHYGMELDLTDELGNVHIQKPLNELILSWLVFIAHLSMINFDSANYSNITITPDQTMRLPESNQSHSISFLSIYDIDVTYLFLVWCIYLASQLPTFLQIYSLPCSII